MSLDTLAPIFEERPEPTAQQIRESTLRRIHRALDVLAPETRQYQDRTNRLALLDDCVCITYYGHPTRRYTKNNGALLTVTETPEISTMSITDIRNPQGEPILPPTILFQDGTLQSPDEPSRPFYEGFSVSVSEDYGHVLYGHIGGGRVALTAPDAREAEEFAIACFLPLENRSHT